MNNIDNKPQQLSLKILGKYILSLSYDRCSGWFRLFSVCVSWKDISMMPLSFSERNGHKKYIKIDKWLFTLN